MGNLVWVLGTLVTVAGLAALYNRSAIFRAVLQLIWAEPIGIVVPTLVAVVVMGTDQMADMIAGLRDSTWGSVAYGAAAAALGLSAWHWMRAVCDLERGTVGVAARREADRVQGWALSIAPRLALIPAALVALAPLSSALDEKRAYDAHVAAAQEAGAAAVAPLSTVHLVAAFAPALLFMALAFLFVWQRARLVRLLHRVLPQRPVLLANERPLGFWRWVWDKPHFVWCLLCATPFGPVAGLFFLALVPAGMLLVAWWPEPIAAISPGPVAALLALATLIPALVVLLALLRRLLWPLPGAKLVGLVLLLMGLGGDWMPDGVYTVRTVPAALHRLPLPGETDQHWQQSQVPVAERRPQLLEAMERWMAACAPGASTTNPEPVLIVAAQGGASRGALWLLSVLRQLDLRTEGRMSQRIFAISAVSGGGLGAATYLQLVRQARGQPGAAACAGPDWLAAAAPHVPVLEQLGRQDFLAPTLGTYFLADMLRRLPLAHEVANWLTLVVPTRAVRLELAFERFWQGMPGGAATASGGLLALRPPEEDGLPHLVFTGTDVESGRRVLTATLDTGSDRGDATALALGTPAFADADDMLRILQADVPLSTAVTNTARFPLVSPPGQFSSGVGRQRRQVVDGGYFESYGVTAAHEMAQALERLSGHRLMPVVLLVSNDADMDELEMLATAFSCSAHAQRALTLQRMRERYKRDGGRVPEGLAPVLGFLATRAAHARAALLDLHADQCPGREVVMPDHSVRALPPGRMAHFALRAPVPPGESAPLNWVLNQAARDFMLDPKAGFDTAFNRQELLGFCRLIGCVSGVAANSP
jgi:hypothetical protein